jgi:hypothetical protein
MDGFSANSYSTYSAACAGVIGYCGVGTAVKFSTVQQLKKPLAVKLYCTVDTVTQPKVASSELPQRLHIKLPKRVQGKVTKPSTVPEGAQQKALLGLGSMCSVVS